MDVLFFLILGHFFGDYALQTDRIAEKKKSSFRSLLYHVLIYTICIWIFLAIYSFLYSPGLYLETGTIIFMIFLYFEHLGQDYFKSRLIVCTRQINYLDQVLHIAILYIYRIFIYSY